MIKMTIKILVALWCLTVVSAVTGNDAGQETPFTVGAGARELGMGGGYTALADDATATYYNPAGLPLLEHQEVSFMHMSLFEGTIYDYVGWVYPDIKLGGFGITIMRIGTDDIIRRSGFVETGKFDYAYTQYLISYGKNLQGGVSLGVNFKIVNQSIDSLSDYGVGFDVGIRTDLHKNISLGLLFRDMVPPELELGSTSETTPISLTTGLAIRDIKLNEHLRLTAAIDFDFPENRSMKTHTGTELTIEDTYYLRAGYDRDNLTLGLGWLYNRFKIDYGYKVMDYIDDSHRFSVSYLIGASVTEKLASEEARIAERGTLLVEDERRRQLDFFKEKADNFKYRFQLDSALVYYQRALAFDENNVEVIGLIAGIENSIKIQRETERILENQQFELSKTITTYLAQANTFFEKKYYNASLDMLQLIFDIHPEHPQALLIKKQVTNAISNDMRAQARAAETAVANGNYFRALEAYNRLLELDPDNKTARDGLKSIATKVDIAQQLNQGIEHYNSGRLTKAKATFQGVLSIDKQNPVAYEYLKKIELDQEKPTTLEDLQKNKEIWQKYLDGLRHMRNKEYNEAIDAWNEVLKVYPNNINTLNNIEQARLRLKSEQSN